jgi:hypothetical protein
MKNTMVKFVFFFDLNWKSVFKVFMLSIPSVLGVYAAGGAEDKLEQRPAGTGMTGTVRFLDATTAPERTSGVPGEVVQSGVRQPGTEREALAGERDLLYRKLIEIIDRYQKQDEDYRRLRLSIAATLASREKHVVGKREEQLLEVLAGVSENGRRLAHQTIEFCDQVESMVKIFPLGKVQSAELALKLDGLRDHARRFWDLTNPSPEPKVNRCRLLAVEEDLQIVVLPVGSAHGVFCGLSFFIGKKASLRVIAVRPYLSAAVLTDGSIRDLVSGMEATTSREQY